MPRTARNSFLARLLFATGVDLSPDARLSHLQAWLLLLDGFVIRTDLTAGVRTASVGGPLIAAGEDERWGGASGNLPALPLLPGNELTPEQWLALIARVEPMARSVRFELAPALGRAHEGHGGEGGPLEMALWFVPGASFMPPLPGEPFLVAQPVFDGLPVTWSAAPRAAIADHGTATSSRGGGDPFLGAPLFTDLAGRIGIQFVPRREEADGQGEVATDVAQVTATAEIREIARRAWVLPDVVLAMLSGTRQATASLEVEWHEADGLRIGCPGWEWRCSGHRWRAIALSTRRRRRVAHVSDQRARALMLRSSRRRNLRGNRRRARSARRSQRYLRAPCRV